MKVKCKPRKADYRNLDNEYMQAKLWNKVLPFNVNPRGILVHRVRSGKTHFIRGKPSHNSIDYWCTGSAVGEGVSLADVPPKDRLLCAHCERIAVEAGELSAAALAGRHVCIGVMKAFRLCCRNEAN